MQRISLSIEQWMALRQGAQDISRMVVALRGFPQPAGIRARSMTMAHAPAVYFILLIVFLRRKP